MQATQLDPSVILSVIVEAKGNPNLARDMLSRVHAVDVSVPEIIDVVKDRLPELKAQMEVVATLELFSLMPVLHKTLVENLTNLEPSDAVSAYMKLMDLITRQTASNEQTLNLNLNDMRWKLAPRELQQVYAQLEASGQLAQVIEHEAGEVE